MKCLFLEMQACRTINREKRKEFVWLEMNVNPICLNCFLKYGMLL